METSTKVLIMQPLSEHAATLSDTLFAIYHADALSDIYSYLKIASGVVSLIQGRACRSDLDKFSQPSLNFRREGDMLESLKVANQWRQT